MPPRYLLDSNIIIDFQNWGHLDDLMGASACVPMAIMEQVKTEVAVVAANDSPEMVGKKRKADRALLGSGVKVVDFLPGSPAKGLYVALAKARTHDRGEAASIAFARHDGPDYVFVSRDKNATLLTLNELSDGKERVMRPFPFVQRLHAEGALKARVVHSVAERAANANSWGLVPSWWATWLAGLPPKNRYDHDL